MPVSFHSAPRTEKGPSPKLVDNGKYSPTKPSKKKNKGGGAKPKRGLSSPGTPANQGSSAAKRLRAQPGLNSKALPRDPSQTRISEHFPRSDDQIQEAADTTIQPEQPIMATGTSHYVEVLVHEDNQPTEHVVPGNPTTRIIETPPTEQPTTDKAPHPDNLLDTLDINMLITEHKAITLALVENIRNPPKDNPDAVWTEWIDRSSAHYIKSITSVRNFYQGKTSIIHDKINSMEQTPDNNTNQTNLDLVKKHNTSIKQIRLKQATTDRNNEMEVCDRTSRIHNMKIRNGNDREQMLKDVISHFKHDTTIKNSLHNATVTPLSREANEDGIRPIAIQFKSNDAKRDFEKFTKTQYNGPVRTSAHWPRDLAPKIKKLRENLNTYKDNDIDLTNCHILIRPTRNCKEISVKYRPISNTNSPWTNLVKFTTPLKDETYKAIGVATPRLPQIVDPAYYYDDKPTNTEHTPMEQSDTHNESIEEVL